MEAFAQDMDRPLPFDVQSLDAPFGGEVTNFDLRHLPELCERDSFLRRVSQNGFLVFRNQDLLPADFARISKYCGDLEFHVLDQYRMAEEPEIYVISNIVKDGKPIGNPKDGFGWHTDQSYVARPTAYTVLYGAETPAVGADTLFASTANAYALLSDELKRRLEGLRGVHSYTYMRTGNPDYIKANAVTTALTEEQVNKVPDVVHPLVRTNPLTGEKSLYLGGDCLAGIEGMARDEARKLIDELFAVALQPDQQVTHKWQPGDVVIWDNRGLMHTATDYDREKYRRLIWRTSVRGEVPH